MSRELLGTVDAIAAVQLESGLIPHHPGGDADPWNHVEAAMALDVGERHEEAERAYEWLVRAQRGDGSWAASYRRDGSVDAMTDANFCSYLAVGVLHHLLATGDGDFVERMWPTVEKGIDLTVSMQLPGGSIAWARSAEGDLWPEPLLTSSACIYLSLGCALEIAAFLGEEPEHWFVARRALGHAVQAEIGFLDRSRFSMDWYYPMLAGVVDGEAAHTRLMQRWDDFVVTGLGARCVLDRPWVTAGETSELVLTLARLGMEERARHLFDWMQHLRDDDGAYWIGATFPDGTVWPCEKPTWGSGAVVLAYDALYSHSPAAGLFTRTLERVDEARAS